MQIRILRYILPLQKAYFYEYEIDKITSCYIFDINHVRHDKADLNKILVHGPTSWPAFELYSIDYNKEQLYDMMQTYFRIQANHIAEAL